MRLSNLSGCSRRVLLITPAMLLAGIMLCAIWAMISPAPALGAPGEPMDIKGTWSVIDAYKDGRRQAPEKNKDMAVIIDDTSITINSGGRMEPVNYKLDTSHSPAWLDLTGGGQTTPAICELKDGVLKICFPKGGTVRPTSFAADKSNGLSLLVLKRNAAPTSEPSMDIKGTWVVIDYFDEGQQAPEEKTRDMWVAISFNTLSVNTSERKEPVEYTLDASHSPAWMDLMLGAHQITPAICELKDGVLKICFHKESSDRPASFLADKANGFSLLVLKRGKAPATQATPATGQ